MFSDASTPSSSRRYANSPMDRFACTAPSSRDELPAGLSSCQVGLFLSLWPETYCITLSEAQMHGLIPIVTALGAQAERVVDRENGFHVPVNDPGAVLNALRRLLDAARAPAPDEGQSAETGRLEEQ